MTPEEFKDQMLKIAAGDKDGFHDREEDHVDADGLLCKALSELGYEEGVRIYKGMDKWYA